MKPRKKAPQSQDDLYKIRLTDLINPQHPLAQLVELIDWERLDAELSPNFTDQGAHAILGTQYLIAHQLSIVSPEFPKQLPLFEPDINRLNIT